MKKRILSILLTVVMVVGLLPMGVWAGGGEPTPVNYTLVLEGGKVYKDSNIYNNGDETAIADEELAELKITGSGTTYTFNGVDFTTTATTAMEIRDTDATIILNGKNSIKGGGNGGYLVGLNVKNNLTITGTTTEDSLTVTSGDYTLEDGASYGISASGNLSITGGSVKVQGGSAKNSNGVLVNNISVSNGTLEAASSKTTGGQNFGIYITSGGVLEVSGGTVKGIGADSTLSSSCGIYVSTMTVTGGTVEGTAGAVGSSGGVYSIGIVCSTSSSISGGTVTASGKKQAMSTAPTATNMKVTAGANADGTDAMEVSDWQDNISSYKYMKFEPTSGGTSTTTPLYIILFGGKVYKGSIEWDKGDLSLEDFTLISSAEISGNGNAENPTYTLNGFEHETAANMAMMILDTKATVELKGKNSITSTASEMVSYGICAINNTPIDLTFTGSGSLEVTAGTCGIQVLGNMTVDMDTNSAKITAKATDEGNISAGVSLSAGGMESANLTVKKGTLDASGQVGIGLNGVDISVEGGTLNASGTNSAINAMGSDLNITGGYVELKTEGESFANIGALTVTHNGNTVTIPTNTSTPFTIGTKPTTDDDTTPTTPADTFDWTTWRVGFMMLRNEKFTVEASASEGGSISNEGTSKVKFDGKLTFKITPDEGYEIVSVLVNGKDVGAVSEYTLKKVRKNYTVSAVFAEIGE